MITCETNVLKLPKVPFSFCMKSLDDQKKWLDMDSGFAGYWCEGGQQTSLPWPSSNDLSCHLYSAVCQAGSGPSLHLSPQSECNDTGEPRGGCGGARHLHLPPHRVTVTYTHTYTHTQN